MATLSKITILYTIPNFTTAGSKYVLYNIIKGLNKDIFEPIVCINGDLGEFNTKFSNLGVRVIQQPFIVTVKPYLKFYKKAKSIADNFNSFKIDIWHSWHYGDNYSEPIISKFAGAGKYIYTKKNSSWGSNAWKIKSILSNHIVIDNVVMKDDFFSSFIYNNKITFIPHGVDANYFRPIQKPKGHINQLKRKIGIQDDDFLIGCIANIIPVKDYGTLIKALVNTNDKVHLICFGMKDRDYAKNIFNEVEKLGLKPRFHYGGVVSNDEIKQFIPEMDLTILTSLSEGLGVVLLESMACEVPCISTKTGAAETIIEEGVNGYIVDIKDHIGIAEKINKCQKEPNTLSIMGKRGREKVIDQYSVDREVKSYEKLYINLR